MLVRYFHSEGDVSVLRLSLVLSAIVIVLNFFIGIYAPVFDAIDDEIAFLDTLWRVVVGQRAGIDYHNPIGFGPYHLGAMLWHWFGPHYYVIRLAIALFGLSIAFCGCIVASQRLARRTDLALLFCVTLAFQLSAPSAYGGSPTMLTMAGAHNRLMVSALAILFLQTFGDDSSIPKAPSVEIATTTFLLNILFLTKISGFLLGLIILLVGCLLQGRITYRALKLCAALLVFAAVTAIELAVSGLELIPLIRDYELAANARLAYSFYDIVRGVVSWPIAISGVLLVLFAVPNPIGTERIDFRRVALVIGSYATCQLALNLTNIPGPSMWLAPAAVVSLAACPDMKAIAPNITNLRRWCWKFSPSVLAKISVREAIPLVIIALVLVPQISSSMFGIAVSGIISFGIKVPYVISAGREVEIKTLTFARESPRLYEISLNQATSVIASLKLDKQAIANLDFSNPFPVLLLAPPPKGINVWWDWGFNVPQGAKLEWKDVIGNACVVTIPAHPAKPDVTARLTKIARSKLEADFTIVYQNETWIILQQTRNCTTEPLL